MKKLALILLFLNPYCTTLSQTRPKEVLEPHEIKEDVRLVWTELQRVHPDLYLYTPKKVLDSLFNQALKWSNEKRSSIELYCKLAPIFGEIRNNHTQIKPSKRFRNYLTNNAKLLPLSFSYRNNILRVVKNYSGNQRLSPGTRVLKINNWHADSLMLQMKLATPTDGFNASFRNYQTSRLLSRRIACFYGEFESFTLVLNTLDDTQHELTLNALEMSTIKNSVEFESKQEPYSFKIEKGIGILRIPTFSIEKLKVFNRFLKESFIELHRKKIGKMIVDVRGNGGGRPEASHELLSYFITQTIYPIHQKYSLVDKLPKQSQYLEDDAFKYFNKERFVKRTGRFYIKNASKEKVIPKTERFLGNTVFLIDEPCASATTSMLGQLREHTNIKFIGREAGGNPKTVVASYVVTLILPNSGLEVMIPLVKSEKNLSSRNTAKGVFPDFEVLPSSKDLTNKNDIILEFALSYFREGLK